MIHNDEGKKFTDDNYARKDEVRSIYNVDDISSVWSKVLSYRSFFNEESELPNCEGVHYQICLTKKILSLAYDLQRKLRNDKLVLFSCEKEVQDQFRFFMEKNSLSLTAKKNGINITNSTLDSIASGSVESLSSSLFLIQAYAEAFQKGCNESCFSIESIHRINNNLLGKDENDSPSLRDKPSQDLYNTLEDYPTEKISNAFSSLRAFLNQDSIPLLLKPLGRIYFFFSVRPYSYFNEETAALAAKAFLSTSGLGLTGYALDFESVAFSKDFQRRKTCEGTLDLTYFLLPALNYRAHIQDTNHELRNKLISSVSSNVDEKESNVSNSADIPVDSLSNSQALPFFPKGKNAIEIEETARNLRQVYPYLKKKQAHFYAGHCTIGLHYTIEQFKRCEDTVYETARTSMEGLAQRGFYKKELIGKKFVYTPIPMGGHENK